MARPKRVKPNVKAFYHMISRIANQAYFMDDKVKKKMLEILHAAAEFSGVVVGTYMLMDNHFHLLVCVPSPEDPIPDNVVLRRVRALYGEAEARRLELRWEQMRKDGRGAGAEAEMNRFRRRMHNVSEFAKTFKQRVAQWYNASHGHVGTLWTGRFKSPLVEEGKYLATCMKYIHRNPVSAGMVKDSSEYVWGAPGAARRGDVHAQTGLAFLSAVFKRCTEEGGVSWKDIVEPSGRDLRFSNGVVIGSRRFVEAHAPDTANRRRRWRPNHIIGDIYSSYGQRSAPMAARIA